jgi:predicted nucleic acid-binding protein
LIVVDTSIVVKWAVEEDGADTARRLIGEELVAPDLLMFELGHVLTKKVRRRELDPSSATIAHVQLPLLLQLTPSRPYESRAFDLSLSLHHAIADCYFLALAEITGSELVTADTRFASKVRGGSLDIAIRTLADIA